MNGRVAGRHAFSKVRTNRDLSEISRVSHRNGGFQQSWTMCPSGAARWWVRVPWQLCIRS